MSESHISTNHLYSSHYTCMSVDRTDDKLSFLFSTTRKRQNTILVKVPIQDESQEEQESGSETSDSVCNGGQSLNTPNGQNVTLITLNAEGTVLFNCDHCTQINTPSVH